MEKLKGILSIITLIVCFIFSVASAINQWSDTSDLPIANMESETGFYYTYE